MRLSGAYRAVALSIVLAGTMLASTGTALAEQIGTFPVSYSHMTTSNNDGNDFVIVDSSTNYQWKFGSGDQSLYRLLGQLNGAGAGNVAQFAYVGNTPATGDAVGHGAWVAPLTASNTPSAYAAAVPADAKSFNASSLTIQPGDATHGPTLNDGTVTIAASAKGEDDGSLQLLKQMLQTYGLDTALQIPTEEERDVTPVGSLGPVTVFLKTGGTRAASTCTSRWSSVKCMLGG